MAKFFKSGKRKKTVAIALGAMLSFSLSLGVIAACGPTDTTKEDEETTTSATDTQLLKNGNFEFYSESEEEDKDALRNLINSPTNWSFSSGSPSSDTTSGIIDLSLWDYYAKSGRALADADDALAHWTDDNVTAYDRLKFYDDNDIDSSTEFSLYGDYRYTVDYEDVRYLDEEVGGLKLHDNDKQVENGDTSVLMIHNRRTSDGVRGTAQYYTSSTTITLSPGTAAAVSVWVRTANLYHYAAGGDGGEDAKVTRRAGAYIGVRTTVGGTTLTDDVQIKNINTDGVTENGGWKQYTVYVRANTYATTTFRLLLGLGQGTSDNRYYAVDGYAFFDDVTCDLISDEAYLKATEGLGASHSCGLDSKKDEKQFEAVDPATGEIVPGDTYAVNLSADLKTLTIGSDYSVALTQEVSGSKTYTSEKIDPSLGDLTNAADRTKASITQIMSLDEIAATSNGYLKTVYENDFKDKFPFENKEEIVMLLSSNGAAYTATLDLQEFREIAPKSRMLISFFVKTSEIRTGKTGAGATLIDGENKTAIASFDSTKAATVDIDAGDEQLTDIYKGWVQCFLFVENTTDSPKSFRLQLTYGPTAISGTDKNDYCDGYAAFANFRTTELTQTQYSYGTTGTYTAKASLTETVKDTSKFDSASANGPRLEEGLALPVNYTGVLADSNVLVETEKDADGNILNANPGREQLEEEYGIYAGLLSNEYASNYVGASGTLAPWQTFLNGQAGTTDPTLWWRYLFGNNRTGADAAYQPLVILNTKASPVKSYGFFAKNTATFSANSANLVSLRVKLSAGATAYFYLTDVSDVEKGYNDRLSPNLPKVTYWYDDDGNIVAKDPADKDFDEDKDLLYTREENGLYKKAGDAGEDYFANLAAYERDDEGNYVTKSGTIAFYHNPKDSDPDTAYADYDEEKETYSLPVKALPANEGVRYTAPAGNYDAVIKVEGTAENADRWVTVNFYVQTGNEAKTYRLEMWAGAREDDAATSADEALIPGNSYVFFDRCTTTTLSNYGELLGETEDAMLGYKDASGAYPYRADAKKLKEEYALYYTFTFFDSSEYLRYDGTKDTENAGDPWRDYVQSSYEESTVYLFCDDMKGDILNGAPTVSMFMSYASSEVTVERAETDTPDTDTSDDDTNSGGTNGGMNIWLALSSGALVIALFFVIIALLVRRFMKRVKKRSSKPAKKAKARPQMQAKPSGEAPAEKAPAPKDDNDPYNE